MSKKLQNASIRDLRRLLASRERQVRRLQDRRAKLAERIAAIDAEIAALGGEVPAVGTRRKARRVRTAGRKPPRKARGGKLVDYVVKVLDGKPDGMRVRDIMNAVLEAGYVTRSKDFYGIVAALLRDDEHFKKLSRGVYALA